MIAAKDLASFDTESISWIAEAGNYIVKIGSSSDKIVKTVSFTVPKEIVVEKCNKVIVPQVKINKTKR